ncbi:unnamed protein product, partial [Nesidiocoris tenuis]
MLSDKSADLKDSLPNFLVHFDCLSARSSRSGNLSKALEIVEILPKASDWLSSCCTSCWRSVQKRRRDRVPETAVDLVLVTHQLQQDSTPDCGSPYK